ncbi:hypothetical protein [Rhodopirellula sp. MGV]|uniref:hypothetical protein n=1 Tax=Rhodopirellula sp. MGV TaxID=2023130 RepID=UPI000B96684B|nr:hypothetical protein [Rhodopirellula sp. MGV]OYP36731.1 hypothetical protein CGZ80_07465 [Rhodopirellula sp. MGV]PNY34424.1 hypothetical protein C2E31_23535 [Rhodopirellula baltica]
MTFDEAQSLWQSQPNDNPAVNKDALMRSVKAKYAAFDRVANVTEVAMFCTLLFVAAMFMRDPIIQGHDRILILAGIAAVVSATSVWTWRRARKRREVSFDNSLLGIIEKSIDGIDDYAARMTSFVFWFGGPLCLGLLLALWVADESKRPMLYTIFIPATLICLGLSYWQVRREIRLKLIPQRTQLVELQRSLISHQATV